jgi:hypothetical protein
MEPGARLRRVCPDDRPVAARTPGARALEGGLPDARDQRRRLAAGGEVIGLGKYRGTLGVAALKASRMLFLKLDSTGHLRWVEVPRALTTYGRLRAVTVLRGGDVLVTTDKGGGDDRILRVRPR